MTDALTGARSRAFFQTRLSQEIERSRRSGTACSLCLFDVDQLKSVNDALGHLRGDEVLRQVAACVSGLLRGSDELFRYGGDEFVLLLPDAGKPQAAELAIRVVDSVGRLLVTGEPPLQVTISLGVASFPEDAPDGSDVVRVADNRAYLAKRQGRGCVVVDDASREGAIVNPRMLERDGAMATAQAFLAGLTAATPAPCG